MTVVLLPVLVLLLSLLLQDEARRYKLGWEGNCHVVDGDADLQL